MSDPNVPLDALPATGPPEKEPMPTEVKEVRRLMWAQSFLGIPGILIALFFYALSGGQMPLIILLLAAVPMLTGPLSLLFRTREAWVLAAVYAVEGISILEYGYGLLLLQLIGMLLVAHIILGVVVIVRLTKAPVNHWFNR